MLPSIETYACAASLFVAELSIPLGIKIIDPGYKINSASGLL